MLKEVGSMASKPLSAEEMTLSKDSLVRSLPADFETNQSTAGTFGAIYVYDLGLDYWSKYPAMIEGVSPQPLKRQRRSICNATRCMSSSSATRPRSCRRSRS